MVIGLDAKIIILVLYLLFTIVILRFYRNYSQHYYKT
jgi:hypothetical protein